MDLFCTKEPEDSMQDACGLFGIYAPDLPVEQITYTALFSLQHRGQEAAGIASFDGDFFKLYKGEGLLHDVISQEKVNNLSGHVAMGHVLYGKRSDVTVGNAQPFAFHHFLGRVAVAMNGGLVNAKAIQKSITDSGAVLHTTSDCELMINLLARYAHEGLEPALADMIKEARGGYAMLIMTKDQLIGLRDPNGIRPLCIGKLDDHYMLASESCAFSVIGAEYIREVEPGEIVIIDASGYKSLHPFQEQNKFCIFEYVYISRPDSTFNGRNVSKVRRAMGRRLAKMYPVKADIVIPVPDSGVACALGYAEASGIPYTLGLLKNRYIGRTFIQPFQKMREMSVHLKLSPIKEELAGKRVIMVDDSIVRGTTSKQIVKMLRDAGAKEVHMMISSPPVMYPCYYGVQTTKDQLISVTKSIDEVCEFIGADSLHYLTEQDMLESTGREPQMYCAACFNGDYIKPPCAGEDN